MKQIIRILSSRIFKISFLIVLQILILCTLFWFLSITSNLFIIVTNILNIVLVIYVFNSKVNPGYRILWIIVILGIPYIGGICYILFAQKKVPAALSGIQTTKLIEENLLSYDPSIAKDNTLDIHYKRQFDYIQNQSGFPIYKNTNLNYYGDINDLLKQLLIDIRSAKHFIFIEFFIICEGYMFNSILDELLKKVREGVKVYMLYDDAGCLTTLPSDFESKLNDLGISCLIFNKLKPRLYVHLNNRNHRKIIVVDNEIAYMGGFNLADEYINKYKKYGEWKDCGIRLNGEAVYNCTVMFIQFYNAISKNDKLKYNDFKFDCKISNPYFVLPFSDSPTDDENLGFNTHLNLINNAKKTLYIQTPYLILDSTLLEALCRASKNNVEIIINTPHIPDKPLVLEVTRNYYKELLEANIKIYEFTPGFLHSKVLVADNNIALIGTINMDYRSYFLHYECGVLINDKHTINDIVKDFNDTIALSQNIKISDIDNISLYKRVLRLGLNVVSPLL